MSVDNIRYIVIIIVMGIYYVFLMGKLNRIEKLLKRKDGEGV